MSTLIKITKNSISFWLILFFYFSTNAQINLVPNPSFESYVDCPSLQNSSTVVPKFWYIPTKSSFCYLNSCSVDSCLQTPYNCFSGINSFQIPKTGNAYVIRDFFQPNFSSITRTYLQCKLLDSLKNNKYYYVEFFVSLVNKNTYSCNNIALFLSNAPVFADTSFYSFNLIPANPQIYNYNNPIIIDTLNWVKVSSIYKAQGGEQFITLGNFKPNNQTGFKKILTSGYNGTGYYIDDVSVIPLDSFCLKADAGKDTTINAGDSIFIGSYTNGIDTLLWLENGTTKIDSTRPGFYVKPATNTFYVLHQIINGCFSSDTINIIVKPLPLNFIAYNVIASETKQSIQNIWTTANEINVSHYNIQRSTNAKDFATIGTVKANNKNYNEYTFIDNQPLFSDSYYRIQSIDKDNKVNHTDTKKITINDKQQTIDVYPNPATTILNIVSKEKMQQIKIINQLGQTLKQFNNLNVKQQTINIEQFSKGIYIIQITTTDQEIKTQKIIIE